jgi:hypothetical protein
MPPQPPETALPPVLAARVGRCHWVQREVDGPVERLELLEVDLEGASVAIHHEVWFHEDGRWTVDENRSWFLPREGARALLDGLLLSLEGDGRG